MSARGIVSLLCAFGPCVVASASHAGSLSFEDAVRQSDRIVVATVKGAGAGSVRLGDAKEIVLGMKDPTTGLVFTPYRIRIDSCLFDIDDSCTVGESEVLVPGGTVYETVEGQQRLRTWELAGAAGVPLPPEGGEILLFMAKRHGRYLPLNDSGARIPVERSTGSATVALRFASPHFLTDAGRESAQTRLSAGRPAMTPPLFIESVQIDRLKSMIEIARQVLRPTSGMRHAIPDLADSAGTLVDQPCRSRVRTG